LLNLNAGFLGSTTASRLLAIAEADMRGELAYVNLKINQSHERGETVATAQAIYGVPAVHHGIEEGR
jgi:hypothetical protein